MRPASTFSNIQLSNSRVGNDETCDIFGAKKAGMHTFYMHTNCSPDYTGKYKATYIELEPLVNGIELP